MPRGCLPLTHFLPYAMIQTITALIRENPALTAILVFLVLVLDTLYVYRTLKRHWKKHSRKSDLCLPQKKPQDNEQ